MSVKLFQSAALGVAALAAVCAYASGDAVTKSAVSPAVTILNIMLSFPKIRSGRIGGAGQPARELRRRCQSVGSAVRVGNLYSKQDAYAFDCNTQHRPKEFA